MLEADARTDSCRIDLTSILDQLREQNEKIFFEFMKTILRHTHFITQKFQEYAPAILPSFPEAIVEIHKFLKEEKGHDKLMEHSLKVLGCNKPGDILPSMETVLLMEIFKKAIDISPMAFTIMIGVFEGGDYSEADPLAEVLEKSSLPETALGYKRHFEINKQENHNEMVYDLAQKLPLQSFESVIFTSRVLELVCHLVNYSDEKLVTTAKSLIK